LSNILPDEELNDKVDQLGEHGAKASPDGGQYHSVTEAQKHHDATPIHQPVTQQPTAYTRCRSSLVTN